MARAVAVVSALHVLAWVMVCAAAVLGTIVGIIATGDRRAAEIAATGCRIRARVLRRCLEAREIQLTAAIEALTLADPARAAELVERFKGETS